MLTALQTRGLCYLREGTRRCLVFVASLPGPLKTLNAEGTKEEWTAEVLLPRGGDYKRQRSWGRIKKRVGARRHVATRRIEEAEVCALCICGPLVSHHSGQHPILTLGGHILEGLECRVNGNFATCPGALDDCFPAQAYVRTHSLTPIVPERRTSSKAAKRCRGIELEDRFPQSPVRRGLTELFGVLWLNLSLFCHSFKRISS
jgi:hypothetical protein